MRRADTIQHCTFTISRKRRAGPGDPAAHRTDRLPLLPSGPGGVHRVLSHRAQPLSIIRGEESGGIVKKKLPYPLTLHVPRLHLAERVGFEPTVPLLGRMLSKHVDSTTLAPLRTDFREAAS